MYNGEDTIQEPYIQSLPETLTKYAFNGDAISIVSADIHYDEQHNPIGTDVVLRIEGKEEPMYLPEVLGDGAVQSLVAAVAAVRALQNDTPVTALRKAIASRAPTPGRMRVLREKTAAPLLTIHTTPHQSRLRRHCARSRCLTEKRKLSCSA